MSFWLEEDDVPPVVASLQQSQSQPTFSCETCGSTEFYHDASTGRDVCQECFTQSQQLYSQSQEETLDYEDVMALAAKTRGGGLVRRKSARKSSSKPKSSQKVPLDGLDQSVPFPDLETCLDGMQRTLKSSVKILARFLFPNKHELQKALISTVGQLWIAYLRAYADAAQHYGALHPELRFSLRDAFISTHQKKMILSHLTWKAAQELQDKDGTKQANSPKSDGKLEKDGKPASKPLRSPPSDEQGEESPGNNRSQDETPRESPADSRVRSETTATTAATGTQKRKRGLGDKPKQPVKENGRTRQVMDRVVRASNAKNRQGYKEAALKLKPSMDFCATLLWLAVCKSGVTSFEFIQHLSDGCLQPMMNAFEHFFPPELQRRLMPIRSFFRMALVPSPYYLEACASILAVACRMKIHDTLVPKPKHKDELCFWSTDCLPLVVAKLVTNAGLDQEVLNRSLALLNLPVPRRLGPKTLPKPLKNATRQEITCNEDILAVVAIACFMDPAWPSWTFHRAQRSPLPYNECHFSLLSSSGPALESYLDFVETNVLDSTFCLVWDDFDNLQAAHNGANAHGFGYNSDDESNDGMPTVKPCRNVAGARVDAKDDATRHSPDCRHEKASTEWIGCSESVAEDPRRRLLISFLAHSTHAKAERIWQKMELFLRDGTD